MKRYVYNLFNCKIEDVVAEIKQLENFVKEKQQLQNQANSFTQDYDKSKVIDINSTGLIRKRERKDENVDANESELGGKKEKLDKTEDKKI